MIAWLNSNPAFLTFLSLLAVFLGWSVIFRNSKKITDRNESYAIIRALVDKLDKTVYDGTSFWLNPSQDDAENIAITKTFINLISHIKSDFKLLEQRDLVFIKSHSIVKLRSALTLNAESANTLTQDERIEKIEELAEAAESLKHECYRKYMTLYPLTK